MNYFKALIVFIVTSLFLVVYVGYEDEGNSGNYPSFYNYLVTDGIADNFYRDSGRHVITVFSTLMMFLAFLLISRMKIMKDFLIVQIIYAVISVPLVLFLTVILVKIIIKLYKYFGSLF